MIIELFEKIYFSDVTSRNNIFDTTGAAIHGNISIVQAAAHQPPPNRVHIYNNTMYSPDTDNDFVGISIGSTVTNAVVRANLAFAPRDTKGAMIEGTGASTAAVVANSNSMNLRLDPGFVGPLSSPPGFRLNPSSYARGVIQGSLSVDSSDFFGAGRPAESVFAIGAIESAR